MNCSNSHRIMSPYIDNELSEGEKKELENHLKVCNTCRLELEEMQGLRNLFENTEEFKAPYGFHTRVMANINTSKSNSYDSMPVLIRLAEAVIVLMLITVGITSGTFLVKGIMPEKAGNEIASLHLDVFESAPPGTLGAAYLAMAAGRNEK